MEDLVAVAKIAKPRGLRGEVVADVLTDFPERFEALGDAILVFPDGSRRELSVERFWFQKGRVILKFAGISKLEVAEELRLAEVCIPQSAAVELDEDEFFDWELEGCEVSGVDGSLIGVVTELMRTAAGEILVVKGESKEYLIPFVEKICVTVDIENKKISVDPPEGLLDF